MLLIFLYNELRAQQSIKYLFIIIYSLFLFYCLMTSISIYYSFYKLNIVKYYELADKFMGSRSIGARLVS